MLMVAPLELQGGTGSPVNPIAVFWRPVSHVTPGAAVTSSKVVTVARKVHMNGKTAKFSRTQDGYGEAQSL